MLGVKVCSGRRAVVVVVVVDFMDPGMTHHEQPQLKCLEFSPFCFDALRRRTAMLVPANSPFPIIMIRYFLRSNYGFCTWPA